MKEEVDFADHYLKKFKKVRKMNKARAKLRLKAREARLTAEKKDVFSSLEDEPITKEDKENARRKYYVELKSEDEK